MGDCEINQNDVGCLEETLALIWLPFLSNSSINISSFLELIEISMNMPFVSSFCFISNYYIYKEQKEEIIEYLISNFITLTDEENDEKCKEPFYSLDSKYAAIFLISFINDKILDEKIISNLIHIFSQRTMITTNASFYISILILIADKYSNEFNRLEVISLLKKVSNLYYFDSCKIKIVIKAWNNIFPFLSQQSFNTDMLAIILGILYYFKDEIPIDLAETQKNALLQNFQGDQDELLQLYNSFIQLNQKRTLIDELQK